MIWDIIGLIFIIYQSLVTPFRIGFNDNAVGFLAVFENLIDLYFIIDLILAFNTGFYEQGVLVMERPHIITSYLKSWFVMDFIASFPYSLVVSPEEYFEIYGKDLASDKSIVCLISYFSC